MSAKEEAYKNALKSLSGGDMGWEHWEQLTHVAAEYFDEIRRRKEMEEECPKCGGKMHGDHIPTDEYHTDPETGYRYEGYKYVLVCEGCGYVDEDYIPF